MKKDAVTDIFISNQLIWSWWYTSTFFIQPNQQVLKDVTFHWEIGGPNISMVSRTRERWSRKELTDTLRIRASSARHLLKQSSSLKDPGMFIGPWHVSQKNRMASLHRKCAAGQRELFFYATFPRLSIWWQRTQGNDCLPGRWEGYIQRAEKGSRIKLSFQNSSLLCGLPAQVRAVAIDFIILILSRFAP